MPDNRQEPSHALMRMVAADGPWADRLVPIAKTRGLIGIYSDYYGWLKPLSARLDIWQTTYVHPLPGVGAVVDWFRGSGLRPFLNPLDECEREQFVARYMQGLADAYPAEADGRSVVPLSTVVRDRVQSRRENLTRGRRLAPQRAEEATSEGRSNDHSAAAACP